MNFIKFGIEFLITFAFVLAYYYYFSIRRYKKDNKNIPVEVDIILEKNKIDSTKIDIYSMIKIVCILTAFILSSAITLMTYLSKNIILSILIGVCLSIVLAVIIYDFIGKYYKKKEKNNK